MRHNSISRVGFIGPGLRMAVLTLCLVSKTDSAAEADAPTCASMLSAGEQAWRAGDELGAARRWGDAFRLCDRRGRMQALARKGEALAALDRPSEADTDLKAALAEATALGETQTAAALEGALGNLEFETGDRSEWEDWKKNVRSPLEKSIHDATEPVILAESYNNYGTFLAATNGSIDVALSNYQKAEDYAGTVSDVSLQRSLRATIALNEARLHLRSKDHQQEADQAIWRSAQFATAMLPSRDKVIALVGITRVALAQAKRWNATGLPGGMPFVDSLSSQALEAAESLSTDVPSHSAEAPLSREIPLAREMRAEVLEQLGRCEEAATLVHLAIADAQQIGAEDILWRLEWLNGRMEFAKGNTAKAIGAYGRAIASFQTIRSAVPIDYADGQPSFRDAVGPLFFGLAEILVNSLPAGQSPSMSQETLTKVVNIVDAYESSELNNIFNDQCLKLSTYREVLSTKLQGPELIAQDVLSGARLGPHDAIVFPFILPDRIETILYLPGADPHLREYHYKIRRDIPDQDPLEIIDGLRNSLKDNTDYESSSGLLYERLIRPIRPDLDAAKIETLVVVADGRLREIPFAALYDNNEHKYLIEQGFALVSEPSLTIARAALAEQEPHPVTENIFAGGIQDSKHFHEMYFPKLPNVEEELNNIKTIHPHGTYLFGKEFTLTRIKDALRTTHYNTVHLASHGDFDQFPRTPYILTNDPDALTLDQLRFILGSRQARDEPLDLLVLSTCISADGSEQTAFGLAGVAASVGARTTVGALWDVYDSIPATLMRTFYENMKDSAMSKAQALRLAELLILTHPGSIQIPEKYAPHHLGRLSPYLWAPFQLVGSWR